MKKIIALLIFAQLFACIPAYADFDENVVEEIKHLENICDNKRVNYDSSKMYIGIMEEFLPVSRSERNNGNKERAEYLEKELTRLSSLAKSGIYDALNGKDDNLCNYDGSIIEKNGYMYKTGNSANALFGGYLTFSGSENDEIKTISNMGTNFMSFEIGPDTTLLNPSDFMPAWSKTEQTRV